MRLPCCGGLEPAHTLNHKHDPRQGERGLHDLQPVSVYPAVQTEHGRFGSLRRRQVAEYRNLDEQQHHQGEYNEGAELGPEFVLRGHDHSERYRSLDGWNR